MEEWKGAALAVLCRTPLHGKADPPVEGERAGILLVAVDLPDAEPFDGMPDKPCAYALPEAFRPNEEHFKLLSSSAHEAGKPVVVSCQDKPRYAEDRRRNAGPQRKDVAFGKKGVACAHGSLPKAEDSGKEGLSLRRRDAEEAQRLFQRQGSSPGEGWQGAERRGRT